MVRCKLSCKKILSRRKFLYDRKRFTKRPVYPNSKGVPPFFACDPIMVRGHLVPNAVELRMRFMMNQDGNIIWVMRKKKLILYSLENINIKNREYLNNKLDFFFDIIFKFKNFFWKYLNFRILWYIESFYFLSLEISKRDWKTSKFKNDN